MRFAVALSKHGHYLYPSSYENPVAFFRQQNLFGVEAIKPLFNR
jgi:hypothetical protein